MGLNYLFCKILCLFFCDEEMAIWLSLLGNTFSGEVLDYVLGKHIDWVVLVVIEIVWDLSAIGIDPLAAIMVVSNESISTGIKTSKVITGLLNLGETFLHESFSFHLDE